MFTRLIMRGGDYLGRTKFVRVIWSEEGLKERAVKITKAYNISDDLPALKIISLVARLPY
jgi:hypothetical protein